MFYFIKDIRFFFYEFIVNKFCEYKVFVWKFWKVYGKSEWNIVECLKDNKFNYKFDYIIKEWYFMFIDVLWDLDDVFFMCFLFFIFLWIGKCYV